MTPFGLRRLPSRVIRRETVAAAVAAAALTIAITGLTHGSGSRVVAAPAGSADVATTVDDFGHALASRDFKKICNDLFTADARVAEGGSQCAATLSANSVLLKHPRLRMTSLSVRGSTATATVVVRQAHQPTMSEIVQLTREGGQFRIASVTSPGD